VVEHRQRDVDRDDPANRSRSNQHELAGARPEVGPASTMLRLAIYVFGMKIPVFVSCPTSLNAEQDAARALVSTASRSQGPSTRHWLRPRARCQRRGISSRPASSSDSASPSSYSASETSQPGSSTPA
jgi:hypothetical protein